MADIDRRAEYLERPFDYPDRAVDAGAETAGIGEMNLHVQAAPYVGLIARLYAAGAAQPNHRKCALDLGLLLRDRRSGARPAHDEHDCPHRDGGIGDIERGP